VTPENRFSVESGIYEVINGHTSQYIREMTPH